MPFIGQGSTPPPPDQRKWDSAEFGRVLRVFEENEAARTQEFVLRWSPDGGSAPEEIVRQQWNFSPPGTIRETEEYDMDLRDVTVLELRILPDQGGGSARASLASLRVA